MPRLDYFAIEEALANQLRDGLSDNVNVLVEEEVSYIDSPLVVIFLDRRRAPADQQTLAAGTSTRFELELTLWCLNISYDGVREAAQLRDDLIGEVERVIMTDRTLQNTVISCWLEGGDFTNARSGDDKPGFISGGTIRLVASARSTTT